MLALLSCGFTFLYQILGLMGIAAPISEDVLMQLAGTALNLLVGVGILVDPTTSGLSDSPQAMAYQEPR